MDGRTKVRTENASIPIEMYTLIYALIQQPQCILLFTLNTFYFFFALSLCVMRFVRVLVKVIKHCECMYWSIHWIPIEKYALQRMCAARLPANKGVTYTHSLQIVCTGDFVYILLFHSVDVTHFDREKERCYCGR